MGKKFLTGIFLIFLLPLNSYSDVIFAVGGVEPRLYWRDIATIGIETYFYPFNSNWVEKIDAENMRGENTILLLWGCDAIRGVNLLVKNNVTPSWLILENPGCPVIPQQLFLVKYPLIFKILFPILGKFWLMNFLKWAFAPYHPDKKVKNSYIIYWSQKAASIPEFLNCNCNINSQYPGKTVILKSKSDKIIIPGLKKYFPHAIILNLPDDAFFIQEKYPFYARTIIKTIHIKRLR